MSTSHLLRRILRLSVAAIAFTVAVTASTAAERKMEARLVWGTNADKSPEASHKKLDGDLAKKLGEMPLKWKNFFEVNRQPFTINAEKYTSVVLSKKCTIEVKDKGGNNVTVKLYGEGKQVNRVDKPLPKGEVLTIGGDAKDNNAWFVIVRPLPEPKSTSDPKKDAVIAKPAAPAK